MAKCSNGKARLNVSGTGQVLQRFREHRIIGWSLLSPEVASGSPGAVMSRAVMFVAPPRPPEPLEPQQGGGSSSWGSQGIMDYPRLHDREEAGIVTAQRYDGCHIALRPFRSIEHMSVQWLIWDPHQTYFTWIRHSEDGDGQDLLPHSPHAAQGGTSLAKEGAGGCNAGGGSSAGDKFLPAPSGQPQQAVRDLLRCASIDVEASEEDGAEDYGEDHGGDATQASPQDAQHAHGEDCTKKVTVLSGCHI